MTQAIQTQNSSQTFYNNNKKTKINLTKIPPINNTFIIIIIIFSHNNNNNPISLILNSPQIITLSTK
jgi:hypothetical protein